MLPENIDDLFRGKLDGHETPPADDLWARLQAQPIAEPAANTPSSDAPNAERLDQLFQTRLHTHATPPARELWERLEDEHLRPRKRRAAAWWPMAMAAAVALFLVAGGAGFWLGIFGGHQSGPAVATQAGQRQPVASNGSAHSRKTALSETQPASKAPAVATKTAVATNTTPDAQVTAAASQPEIRRQKQISTGQATPSELVASTASKARKFAERQSPRPVLRSNRQPDVAAPSPSLVARTTPAVAPAPARNTAPDEPRLNPAPAPVVAQNPTPTPPAEIVPPGTVITVDVRNGATPAGRSIKNTLSAVASAEEPAERRGLGGRLLQQANHLVRGERLSLAEATGLPENVTLRATIGGRTVSKSIQL